MRRGRKRKSKGKAQKAKVKASVARTCLVGPRHLIVVGEKSVEAGFSRAPSLRGVPP